MKIEIMFNDNDIYNMFTDNEVNEERINILLM